MEVNTQVLELILKLLRDSVLPPLAGELAENPLFCEIYGDIKTIREVLRAFSEGDMSSNITARGVISGYLKTFQAHLRHMVWQIQMVEQGDFSQQLQFLGEFSTAFNHMVSRMDMTVGELTQKEKDLRVLAESLKAEINLRNNAVEALQESESRFKYLASHDPLTGALNRRSFMERANIELASALALNVPCGVVMMDLDHFKIFNDTYGHQAGDEALRHAVVIIHSMLRKNDFLGRYGGEEFIFFFSHADKARGVAISERVREAIASSPIKLEAGPVFIYASFGLAMIEDLGPGEDSGKLDALIRGADRALYYAKGSGRNKVVCFDRVLMDT
jgi:diguanylate cyclase (GGDEF)-like protein